MLSARLGCYIGVALPPWNLAPHSTKTKLHLQEVAGAKKSAISSVCVRTLFPVRKTIRNTAANSFPVQPKAATKVENRLIPHLIKQVVTEKPVTLLYLLSQASGARPD